jgi:hypothetical protein
MQLIINSKLSARLHKCSVSCRFIMTERKQLKKKLAKLKHYKANLPRLIDCSNVYGDDFYSKDDLSDVDKQIEEVEKQIAEIDRLSENGS